MATSFPAPYFKAPLNQPAANAGRDLLSPVAQTASMVRPKIGGRSTRKQQKQQRRARRGGFVPSVGEGFSVLAGKYIVPIALFGIYKLLNTTTNKSARKTRRRRV